MTEENKNDQTELTIGEPTRFLNRIAETDQVDYKTKFSKDKEELYNTVKVFAAMANSGGGLVIYGIQKQQLVGIDDVQSDLLDPARLKGMLNGFLSPVPSLSTEFITHRSMKFGFVSVAGITTAPVLVAKSTNDSNNKQVLRAGAFYIRDNTESVEATSEYQIRHILDQVINFQTRKRVSEIVPIFSNQTPKMIEEVPSIETLGRKQAKQFSNIDTSTPIREAIYYIDTGQVFNLDKLKEIFKLGYKLSGLVWPHYAINVNNSKVGASEGGFISSFRSDDDGRRFFARIDPNVSVYSCSTLLEDNYPTRSASEDEHFKGGVGVGLTLNLVVLAVRLGHAYLKKLEVIEELTLRYSLRNVKDRKLIIEEFSRGDFYTSRVSLDDNISSKITIRKSMSDDDLKKICQELVSRLYEGFNWSDPPSGQIKIDIQGAFNKSFLEQKHLDI